MDRANPGATSPRYKPVVTVVANSTSGGSETICNGSHGSSSRGDGNHSSGSHGDSNHSSSSRGESSHEGSGHSDSNQGTSSHLKVIDLEDNRQCACKGVRSCLICETDGNAAVRRNKEKESQTKSMSLRKTGASAPSTTAPKLNSEKLFHFCPLCRALAWFPQSAHPYHSGSVSLPIHGVVVVTDFVSEAEEKDLCERIDETPWAESQSGRRKQDYGPKVNFKRKKLKSTNFTGLPGYSRTICSRLTSLPQLTDFIPVELCALDYQPERGAAIEPHFDDFWLWGERLVTLNLMSETAYTLTLPPSAELHTSYISPSKLVGFGKPPGTDQSPNQQPETEQPTNLLGGTDQPSNKLLVTDQPTNQQLGIDQLTNQLPGTHQPAVRVALPRRSLVVLEGEARHNWHHSIRREDIDTRRLGITIRELSSLFLTGGSEEDVGRQVMEIALTFNGLSVGEMERKKKADRSV